MTLAQIRARVRHDLTAEDTDMISVANLDLIILEGAEDLAKKGHALPVSGTWNAVANTQRYVLSGASPKVENFLEIYYPAGGLVYTQSSGVTKTQPQDFQIVDEAWLDINYPGWQDDAASDTLQHVFLSYDANGYLNLGVHPKSKTTTPTFKLWFLSRGTDMDGATKEPWLNTTTVLPHLQPYHKLIAYYALWQVHALKTFKEKLEAKYMNLYLGGAMEMKESQDALFKARIEGLRSDAQVTAGQSFGSI